VVPVTARRARIYRRAVAPEGTRRGSIPRRDFCADRICHCDCNDESDDARWPRMRAHADGQRELRDRELGDLRRRFGRYVLGDVFVQPSVPPLAASSSRITPTFTTDWIPETLARFSLALSEDR